MRAERFSGKVPVGLDCYSPAGLMQVVKKLVPRDERRHTLGYRLVEIADDPADAASKLVTIEVLRK